MITNSRPRNLLSSFSLSYNDHGCFPAAIYELRRLHVHLFKILRHDHYAHLAFLNALSQRDDPGSTSLNRHCQHQTPYQEECWQIIGPPNAARSPAHLWQVAPATLPEGASVRQGLASPSAEGSGKIHHVWPVSVWGTCVAPDAPFSKKDGNSVLVHLVRLVQFSSFDEHGIQIFLHPWRASLDRRRSSWKFWSKRAIPASSSGLWTKSKFLAVSALWSTHWE